MNRIKKKGFTLMELIIVIAIIGILASIIYPGFISYTEKARLTKAIQDAKAFVAAVDTYNADQEEEVISEETDLTSSELRSAIVGADKAIIKLPTEFDSAITVSKIRVISNSKTSELNYDKETGKVDLKAE